MLWFPSCCLSSPLRAYTVFWVVLLGKKVCVCVCVFVCRLVLTFAQQPAGSNRPYLRRAYLRLLYWNYSVIRHLSITVSDHSASSFNNQRKHVVCFYVCVGSQRGEESLKIPHATQSADCGILDWKRPVRSTEQQHPVLICWLQRSNTVIDTYPPPPPPDPPGCILTYLCLVKPEHHVLQINMSCTVKSQAARPQSEDVVFDQPSVSCCLFSAVCFQLNGRPLPCACYEGKSTQFTKSWS